MNILHTVYTCIPGKYKGGIPKIVYELSKAQVRLGHRVVIYTSDINGTDRELLPAPQITSDGVDIRYFEGRLKPRLRSPAMRESLMSEPAWYDIIHGHSTFLPFNQYALEAARGFGKPAFLTPQGALDPVVLRRGRLKYFKKWLYITLVERRLMNAAAVIFALTPHERDQVRLLGVTAPIEIVPNGIDRWSAPSPERVEEFKAQFGIRPGQPVLGYLGRIVYKKGVHLLIEAYGQLRTKHPGLQLMLAGDRHEDPGYTRRVDETAASLGLTRDIRWIGFLEEKWKPAFLSSCTVFSHVSESEGMAMAILEAMSSGLPVLVTSQCYMDQAVQAGAVAECSFDSRSLSETVERLLQDASWRATIGARAAAYVEAHHDWDRVADEIVAVYRGRRAMKSSLATASGRLVPGR